MKYTEFCGKRIGESQKIQCVYLLTKYVKFGLWVVAVLASYIPHFPVHKTRFFPPRKCDSYA